jgi:hypothetical protein
MRLTLIAEIWEYPTVAVVAVIIAFQSCCRVTANCKAEDVTAYRWRHPRASPATYSGGPSRFATRRSMVDLVWEPFPDFFGRENFFIEIT